MNEFFGTDFKVQKLHRDARLPTRNWGSAGYDLYSVEDAFIYPGGCAVIPIGIATEFPENYYARIADRSGLAAKKGLTVLGGVVDADYRGEWKVILHNTSQFAVPLDKGSRVAQAIITPCVNFEVVEVDHLVETARGTGGFGSTGI